MLKAGMLADSDIRPALRRYVRAVHPHESGTVLLEELGVCRGQVRVDLAAINGAIHGYEIKSDRDSLRLLAGQVEVYGRVLDRATLVVGARHVDEAMSIVPSWWGVLLVAPTATGPAFVPRRRDRLNRSRDPRAMVELLW